MPSHCVHGHVHAMSVKHALNCPCGDFPSISHNEVRDITNEFLSEVCHNVSTEPSLQPPDDDCFSTNTEVRARLDVVAEAFWGDCFV